MCGRIMSIEKLHLAEHFFSSSNVINGTYSNKSRTQRTFSFSDKIRKTIKFPFTHKKNMIYKSKLVSSKFVRLIRSGFTLSNSLQLNS